jgi:hypothetical protein
VTLREFCASMRHGKGNTSHVTKRWETGGGGCVLTEARCHDAFVIFSKSQRYRIIFIMKFNSKVG